MGEEFVNEGFSDGGILVSTLTSLVIGVVILVVFEYLRGKEEYADIFLPRTDRTHPASHCVILDKTEPEENNGLEDSRGCFRWIRSGLNIPDRRLLRHIGLDAFLYLRFSRFWAVILAVVAVACVGLVPINNTGDNAIRQAEKDDLHYYSGYTDWLTTNLEKESDWLFAHVTVFLLITVVFWVLLKRFIREMLEHKTWFVHAGRGFLSPSAHTVLIKGIDPELRDPEVLRQHVSATISPLVVDVQLVQDYSVMMEMMQKLDTWETTLKKLRKKFREEVAKSQETSSANVGSDSPLLQGQSVNMDTKVSEVVVDMQWKPPTNVRVPELAQDAEVWVDEEAGTYHEHPPTGWALPDMYGRDPACYEAVKPLADELDVQSFSDMRPKIKRGCCAGDGGSGQGKGTDRLGWGCQSEVVDGTEGEVKDGLLWAQKKVLWYRWCLRAAMARQADLPGTGHAFVTFAYPEIARECTQNFGFRLCEEVIRVGGSGSDESDSADTVTFPADQDEALKWDVSLAPDSNDVLWDNMHNDLPSTVAVNYRTFLYPALTVGLVIVYSTVVAFLASIQNLQNLPGIGSAFNVSSLPPWLAAFISAALPVILVVVFNILVPIMFRFFNQQKGAQANSLLGDLTAADMCVFVICANIVLPSVLIGGISQLKSLSDNISARPFHEVTRMLATMVAPTSGVFIALSVVGAFIGTPVKLLRIGGLVAHYLSKVLARALGTPVERYVPEVFESLAVYPAMMMQVGIGLLFCISVPITPIFPALFLGMNYLADRYVLAYMITPPNSPTLEEMKQPSKLPAFLECSKRFPGGQGRMCVVAVKQCATLFLVFQFGVCCVLLQAENFPVFVIAVLITVVSFIVRGRVVSSDLQRMFAEDVVLGDYHQQERVLLAEHNRQAEEHVRALVERKAGAPSPSSESEADLSEVTLEQCPAGYLPLKYKLQLLNRQYVPEVLKKTEIMWSEEARVRGSGAEDDTDMETDEVKSA